jgi:hypothetical protein
MMLVGRPDRTGSFVQVGLARGLHATPAWITVNSYGKCFSCDFSSNHPLQRCNLYQLDLSNSPSTRRSRNSPRDYHPVFVSSRYQQIYTLGLPQLAIQILTLDPEGQSNPPYKYINALHSPSIFRLGMIYRRDTRRRIFPRLAPPVKMYGVDKPRFVGLSQSQLPSHTSFLSRARLNSWTTIDFSFKLATDRINPISSGHTTLIPQS